MSAALGRSHVARLTKFTRFCMLAAPLGILYTALSPIRVAAQPEAEPASARSGASAEQIDEIVVLGTRSLRSLRLEVQSARERVYDLFNSLNSDDDFNIQCYNAPRIGTRIPQRVCRPQYADIATADASEEFHRLLVLYCDGQLADEGCIQAAAAPAQATVSAIPLRDRQLAAEVQRLTRESPVFRRAITEYMVAERQYDQARRSGDSSFEATATIVDTAGAPSRRASRQASPAPRPVDLVAATLPWSRSAASSTGEGWVRLHYTVQADGSTADVRAIDVVPPSLDPSTAITAVEAWRFEPAELDGAPVDWHYNAAVITFSRGGAGHAAWPEFAEAYEAVAERIADRQYEDARAGNETMLTELAFTLEEIALAQMQRAAIEHALGDLPAALTAIRHATDPEVQPLGDKELRLALEHRFALELELGRAPDALQTFERRSAIARIPSRDPLARQAAALREALAAPETSLAIQARIDDWGRWDHVLHWNTFAIGDVGGETDDLNLACHLRKLEMPLEEDMEISIPPGWGRCALSVTGQPGTSFTLYEFQAPLAE